MSSNISPNAVDMSSTSPGSKPVLKIKPIPKVSGTSQLLRHYKILNTFPSITFSSDSLLEHLFDTAKLDKTIERLKKKWLRMKKKSLPSKKVSKRGRPVVRKSAKTTPEEIPQPSLAVSVQSAVPSTQVGIPGPIAAPTPQVTSISGTVLTGKLSEPPTSNVIDRKCQKTAFVSKPVRKTLKKRIIEKTPLPPASVHRFAPCMQSRQAYVYVSKALMSGGMVIERNPALVKPARVKSTKVKRVLPCSQVGEPVRKTLKKMTTEITPLPPASVQSFAPCMQLPQPVKKALMPSKIKSEGMPPPIPPASAQSVVTSTQAETPKPIVEHRDTVQSESSVNEIALKDLPDRRITEEDVFPGEPSLWKSTVTEAMHNEANAETAKTIIVARRGCFSVTAHCMRRLCIRKGWINDAIIDFYFDMIVERSRGENFPTVHAFSTQFFQKLKSYGATSLSDVLQKLCSWTRKNKNLLENDLLFVPMLVREMHWVLCVIDNRKRTITYFDSLFKLIDSDPECVHLVKLYLEAEMKKREVEHVEYKIIEAEAIPKQNNGVDCGAFVMKYAEYISRDAPLTFHQDDMAFFRYRAIMEIISLGLLPDKETLR